MGELGISVYPEHTDLKRNFEYIKKAAKLGYSRLFTSLLEIKGSKEDVLEKFKAVIDFANELNFKTIIDINPTLFKQLGIGYDDLSFFKKLGVWGIRLDLGFTGLEEALMTRNPYDLKIEVNMSTGTNYLENIMSYSPKTENLLGCHNFYPQAYTGLSESFVEKYSQLFKKYSLNTAAFVSSNSATVGPWPVQDGLPTIEEDRQRQIELQVEHLKSFGLIDDVIIGNAFATDEELEVVARSFFSAHPVLQVELAETISNVEREAVLDMVHLYRGDTSEYLLRDQNTRVKFKDTSIKAHDTHDIKCGDLIMVNDNYGQYSGEMQIALLDIKNDGRRNVIGKVLESNLFLLKKIKPWSTFLLN
ncbi:DUF871 domain-containing protein [Liquorilactobacillus cacaonum]|uniref:Outer surface protein n=1 Tax=Liquorilactobacillus cacaonum DSM 21116 TaxID=1423729 RepID=A0A0R2CW19_9LACO|nr:MupG family TIM beta-alpha barrel fold protein [Liquorilactobacillus cacaonum]KRM92070.1 hypothetical protein FC80_GL000251 [Liquorilactobacillus cacaonum DSM 21116]